MTREVRTLGDRIAQAKREIRDRSRAGVQWRMVRAPVTVRATTSGVTVIEGHGAVFNSLSEDLGFYESWYERIDPGAFDSVLAAGPDVRALVNHNPDLPLGRSTVTDGPGSLRLSTDSVGLAYEIEPTDTTYGRDLLANLAAGVVNQSSFAFRLADGGVEWSEIPDPNDPSQLALLRTILDFSELYDVSPVTYPAYPAADSGLGERGVTPTDERDGNGPAGERAVDGVGEEPQGDTGADAQAQRDGAALRARQRRLRLRERALD